MTPGRVLVVGGGPAGLEAARVSAERGHGVMLVRGDRRARRAVAPRRPAADAVSRCSTTSAGTPPSSNGSVSTSGAGGWSPHADVADEAADHVVVAIGAVPPAAGFQRALRLADRLPGVELGHATTAQDVLAGTVDVDGSRAAARRRRRLAGDRYGDVPPGARLQRHHRHRRAAVAGGLFHSAADVPTRRRFALSGGELAPNTVVTRWCGDAATLRSTLTGRETQPAFDWLVIAGTPVARAELAAELERLGVVNTSIGDCLAPRTAAAAILDGRRAALAT